VFRHCDPVDLVMHDKQSNSRDSAEWLLIVHHKVNRVAMTKHISGRWPIYLFIYLGLSAAVGLFIYYDTLRTTAKNENVK